jgi:hypothetical protein
VLHVEIATGVVVRIDRRAVAARVEPETDNDAEGTLPFAEQHDDLPS